MSNELLEVATADEILEGWESVSVSRAVDRLAGTYTLEFAELAPTDPRARKLLRGEVLRILVDGQLVLSGPIVGRTKAYTATSNSITVYGRDPAGDLVECAATNEPGEWNGARIATIASDILAPFTRLRFREDLSVSSLGSETKFALETGESAFSALDRLARMRGLLLASDLEGGVYFTRPGEVSAPVTLELGANIEAGTMIEDDSTRFSRYIAHGQASQLGAWDIGGVPGQSFRAFALDPGISRFRPFIIHAEAAATEADLELRAKFEASVRLARSQTVSYSLPNWRLDGYLWTPGDLVGVYDPNLEIGSERGTPVDRLIGSVNWTGSATGPSTTDLELFRPGSFAPEPIPTPKSKGSSVDLENWFD